ncbi:mucin-22 isoform X1 [Eurytemora carolleeae]|uniref:mucin-22 isoform X1 n=1 Tax=Eurytemora carolleeae TaxID=1294199 RepID=UPI000C78A1C4|nr:mucin-22 isoform X1 [Eurytemora carolleeae]|eukprot:XP_023334520.1 mucin-22-like isoform X1 [Eurytemora affinis]
MHILVFHQYIRLFILEYCIAGLFANLLFNINQERSLDQLVPTCCQSRHILSCQRINVEFSSIGQSFIVLPDNMTLNFSNFITLNEKGLHYSSDEANAVLAYNPQEMSLHGHIQFATGESYTIENCKKQGHIWKQIDVNNLVEHSVNDIADLSIAVDPPQNQTNPVESNITLDTVTIVEFSVKIYYTREFATVTQDIAGYLNLMIAETNQGYINSQVPLRIFIHETEEATMRKQDDSTSLLYAFTSMKSSVKELRGSADTAVLLVNSMDACGIAFLNTISSGNTVAVVMKSCAVGYFTFGHEIAHSFGCQHDPQTSTNRDYPDGHGHLIPRGQASQGYRTILAYSRTGFETRANYYSNPDIRHDITNSFTGVRGISNNARILTENRLRMAAVGDESIIGGSTSTASTSAVPTSTASTSEFPTSTASTTKVPNSTASTTEVPTSTASTTEVTTSTASTTKVPTTTASTTKVPTTTASTTEVPTSTASTTEVPTSTATTTEVPTSSASTTEVPTSTASTTEVPTSTASTAKVPTSTASTTEVQTSTVTTTEVSTSAVSTTEVTTSTATTTEVQTSTASTTEVTTSAVSTTEFTTSSASTTEVPTSTVTTTEVPTSTASTTEVPTSTASTTEVPTSTASTTEVPTSTASTTEVTTSTASTTKVQTSTVTTTEVPTSTVTTTEVPTSTASTTEVQTSTVTTTEVPTSSASTTEVPTSTASSTEVPTSTASTTEVPTSTTSTTEGLTSTVQTTEGLSSIAASTESASILGSSSIIELFPGTTNRPETSTAKTAGLINEPAILPTTSSFPLLLRPITVTALSSTPSTSSTLTSTLKDDPECCKDSSLPTLSYIFNFQVFARSSLECQKICAAESTCTFWNFYIFNGICDLRQLEYEKNHYWKTSPKICYKPPDYSCRLRNNKFVLSYTPVHANERECRLVCERSYYCEYWAYLTIYDNRPRCRIYFLTSNAYGWISGQFNITCSNYK